MAFALSVASFILMCHVSSPDMLCGLGHKVCVPSTNSNTPVLAESGTTLYVRNLRLFRDEFSYLAARKCLQIEELLNCSILS